MPIPILATKLYIPPPPSKIVSRPRLIEQLNKGLGQNQGFGRKLTLISAPAGFGKTTLVSEWVNQKDEGRRMKDERRSAHPSQVAWLSLDEGDNDLTRFLTYCAAALQTIMPTMGEGVLAALQSPQPPATESILTVLINEITAVSHPILLILDDYHLIDSQSVDQALAFLLDHLPPQMHLVITTREDPNLPLARYRVRNQLTELRAANLRFTADETADFLTKVMSLNLSTTEIAALETRTEGWIAGLQLAALSMQGQESNADFIQSFTGSHRFVLDYLLEEVLNQQPAAIQTFLLHTSILDRMCGSLCDAVLQDADTPGQKTLVYLEQSNLFIMPLDNERRWYRYHHLFGDLLKQRLQQSPSFPLGGMAELHSRASIWYEANGLEIEAFQHAAAANDVERAERLMDGRGMPLLFRGAVGPVMNWLASLPTAVLDARPSLWVTYASALLFISQISGVEEKLQAAETVLNDDDPDVKTRDQIGHIASIRATVAVLQNELETIIFQSHRALAYLAPNNLPVRTATTWTLGIAYHLQGDRAAARKAYTEAIVISKAIGHFIITNMCTLGLGNLQESENQLHVAAETYYHALQLIGDLPQPIASEAHLGLARISYEWNDLDTAEQHGQKSVQLARLADYADKFVACEVFVSRLKLAQGDVAGAMALLAQAEQSARQHDFGHQILGITAVKISALLQQNKLEEAAQLAEGHDLPLSQARVHLAQGNADQALAVLAAYRQQIEAKGWADERLRVMVLQAVAYEAQGDGETAVSILNDALTLAEPGGFIRTFVDEGQPLVELLTRVNYEGRRPALSNAEGMKEYVHSLLAAFGSQKDIHPSSLIPHPLLEPLSERELEVLQLVAQGLSNREISEQLFLAVDTVKGHNRRIFSKLQVQNRTEAVARARELGMIQ